MAFKKLAQISNLIQRPRWLQQAIEAGKEVSDFENCVRAYIQLTRHLSFEEGFQLFLSALDDVERIPEERKKQKLL